MSNPERIEIGDSVYVMYPGHPNDGRAFPATVEYMPNGVGDSWIFINETHGDVIYISEPISVSLTGKAVS